METFTREAALDPIHDSTLMLDVSGKSLKRTDP